MENPFKKAEVKEVDRSNAGEHKNKVIRDEVMQEKTASNENKPIVITTEIDAYISEIVRGGPQNIEDIQVRDYSQVQGKHRLSLPEEIEKKYGKKYAFRWVNKKKDWIDRAISIRRWLIVNRLLFSDMPKYLFTANGTIENGDAILCFMPMVEAERLRQEPRDKSTSLVKDLPMEKWKDKREDSPYYKPDLGSSEKDGEMVTTGITPDVQTQNE